MMSQFRFSRSWGNFAPIALLALAWVVVGGVRDLSAQAVEENYPGVSLGITYETRSLPVLAIQPFSGTLGGEEIARIVENIIAQDLKNSNRFIVRDQLPAALVRDEVDYGLWNQMQASWLVTGRVEGSGSDAELILELHDVLFGAVRDRSRYSLPPPSASNFRMAVHASSDDIVQWAFGEPGIAATRIAFSRRMDDGTQDLWVIDSDGENLQRLTNHQATQLGRAISLTPAWSPDGTRLAYMSYKDVGESRIYELDLRTGRDRMIPAPRQGGYWTPAYHPDGERLFFAVDEGDESGIYSYNITRDCCFTNLMQGRSSDLSPTFAPDGSAFAFNSSRLGIGSPQIYWTPAGSISPTLLSPYEYGRPGYYTAPDWAPMGNRIAFHGWVDRRGQNQILVAELDARNRLGRLSRVTTEGLNEDPSWAPDGRHLVYVGERSWGYGLFIVDVLTPGSERILLRGVRVNPPAWSPSLAP